MEQNWMTEWNRISLLEGTFRDHLAQLVDHFTDKQKLSILLRSLSKCFLNADRHGVSSSSLGSLFQCLTILVVNKSFLMPSLNLFWYSLVPLLCILSLVTREQSPAPPSTSSARKVTERNVVTSWPPPYWTNQLSLFFPHRTFWPCYQLCCQFLDAFKDPNVLFILWSPELQGILKVLNTAVESPFLTSSLCCVWLIIYILLKTDITVIYIYF